MPPRNATPTASAPSAFASAAASRQAPPPAKAQAPGGQKPARGPQPPQFSEFARLPAPAALRQLLEAGQLGALLHDYDWSGHVGPGRHAALLDHLHRLPAQAQLSALAQLAEAAAAGHPHARGYAQRLLANLPPGRALPHEPFRRRASVLNLEGLAPGERSAAESMLAALPRLAGTPFPVGPAGMNWQGLLGEGVVDRPVTAQDLHPRLANNTPRPVTLPPYYLLYAREPQEPATPATTATPTPATPASIAPAPGGSASTAPSPSVRPEPVKVPRAAEHAHSAFNPLFDQRAQQTLARLPEGSLEHASLAAHIGVNDWTGHLVRKLRGVGVHPERMDDVLQDLAVQALDPEKDLFGSFQAGQGDFAKWWARQVKSRALGAKHGRRRERDAGQILGPGHEGGDFLALLARAREPTPDVQAEHNERQRAMEASPEVQAEERRMATERSSAARAKRERMRTAEADRGQRHWIWGSKGKELLEREYVQKGRSTRDVAREIGAGKNLVFKALHHHGLPVRDYRTAATAGFAEGTRKDAQAISQWLGSAAGKAYLAEQYEDQKRSGPEIAKELRVSSKTVYKYLERHGFTTRFQARRSSKDAPDFAWFATPEAKAYLEQHYGQGKSVRSLAEELGVHQSVVRKAFARHEIPLRSAKEQGALNERLGRAKGGKE